MADVCRIVVVGLDPIFRGGMVEALRCDQRFVVAAHGMTAQDAEHLAREHELDVLVLEAAVPSSLTAALAILGAHQKIKLIFLASDEDEEHVSHALHMGVHGYILKTITGQELVHALAMIHGGGRYISHDLSWRLLTNRAPTPTPPQIALSLREQQVLDHTLDGLTNRQIACKLGLSLGALKYHKTNVFRKLGVHNSLGLVATMNGVAKR
jgi:DNA-binding NarL/FixJ family response regulator